MANFNRRLKLLPLFSRAALATAVLCAVPALSAQQPGQNPTRPQPEQRQAPQLATEGPQSLHLIVGRSLVITSPTRIKRLSLADPNIAEAIVISPYQVQINGKTPGGVSLLLWDESDQSQAFDVFVDMDILGLSQKIHEVFPSEPVQVEASKDVVMLSGKVTSKLIADKIYQVVSQSTPKVVSLMEVPTAPTTGEIMLEVKFAEVDRAAISQLGVNLLSTGAGRTIGTTTTGQFGGFAQQKIEDSFPVHGTQPAPPNNGTIFQSENTINDVLNIFLFRPDIHLGVVIRALQQRNLLQILAEPNLLTQTDKEASFLAGGEFPFPVVQPSQGGFTSISITFKEFGVRLTFKPTITEEGRIHLRVRPEVSALDFSNALTISGFLIPALSTRRVDTEMELADGQSFAIAGLVDDRVTRSIQKVPGLGDIPILGQLFRSRSVNKSKTELLVMVTPHIVKPFEAGQQPKGPQFPVPFLPPATPEGTKPAAPDGAKPSAQK